MKTNGKRRRGAVLLATLFLVLVISMFVGAASQVGLRSLTTLGATSESAQAEAAAESGIQYALFRLRQNANWRGDGNAIVVDTPELLVREDQGNVVGFLGNGQQFRLRFNYQDGEGAEGLPDPELSIDHQYVSVNNMLSGRSVPVPRADGPGASVSLQSPRPYEVPEFTACLIVEGRAGSSLIRGDFTGKAGSRRVASRVVEGFYRVDDISELTLDAAAMAGRTFEVELPDNSGQVRVETRDGHGRPRVRSKGKVDVNGGERYNYTSPLGQVLSGNGQLRARAGGQVATDKEDPTSPFYQLTWEQVRQADSTTSAKLPAGTYVWWKDNTLHHYDMDYQEYEKFIKKNAGHPGVTPVLPAGIEAKPSERSLVVTQDVEVVPGNAKGFAVIPRSGAPEGPPLLDPLASAGGTSTDLVTYFQNNPEQFAQFLMGYNGSQAEGSIELSGGLRFAYKNADDPANFAFGIGVGGIIDIQESYQVTPGGDPIALFIAGAPDALPSATGFLNDNGLGDEGALDLPGIADDLTPEDVSLNFSPKEGASAVLSSPGNVRIGAQLKGQGGSIVSQESIRVVGFGADFSANPNAESGISMYAKKNIGFSTYLRDKDRGGKFQDVRIRGVMYAWGDINAGLGHKRASRWGRFDLEGAMVAYGGSPGTIAEPKLPGSGKGGAIRMTASDTRLIFDPAYLLSIMSHGPQNLPMRRTLWKRY